ncbi:MAG: glycine oxidase ThiO [Gemmatimonadota bacterium]
MDVIVIGGGLIGCTVARALARTGRRVVVCDAGPGRAGAASRAAAGMLAPQMEDALGLLAPPGAPAARLAMLALCLASRERFGAFREALAAESGEAIPLVTAGTLVVARGEAERAELERAAAAQVALGLHAAMLSGAEARGLEPGLAPDLAGPLWLPDDHQVDAAQLTVAAAGAARREPRIAFAGDVTELLSAAGRMTGVRCGARQLAARQVVVAAGAWSGALAGLPLPLPVRPVKGQMLALQLGAAPLVRTVVGRAVYAVPRGDGRVLLGATVEEAGFDVAVRPAASEALHAHGARLLPALAAAPLLDSWAGLRPGTPDGLPILGADPEIEGLFYATGHFRNGILLAPITGDVLTAAMADTPFPLDVTPFSVARFRRDPRGDERASVVGTT